MHGPHVRGAPLLVLHACAAHGDLCYRGGLEGASAVKRCMGVNNEFPIDRVDKNTLSATAHKGGAIGGFFLLLLTEGEGHPPKPYSPAAGLGARVP